MYTHTYIHITYVCIYICIDFVYPSANNDVLVIIYNRNRKCKANERKYK